MGEIHYICESCLRARATKLSKFYADGKRPAATYKICGPCAMDVPPEKGEVTPL